MQNLAKKQWGSSLSIKEAADMMIEWCVKAREKNILRKKPAQIYYAYILEDMPPLQYFHNISPVFRYSQKDVPYIDQARDSLLRCLSVALKTHFFFFQEERVAHEPYFFAIPSLRDNAQTIFGLIYKIEKGHKTIVVCDKRLNDLFEDKQADIETAQVVIEDSFKWYHMKNWSKVKITSQEEFNKIVQSAKDAKTKEELASYATILDVPYEIKDMIKPLGTEWSNKLKTWYLPKGLDLDSLNEYLNYAKKEIVPVLKAKAVKKDNPEK